MFVVPPAAPVHSTARQYAVRELVHRGRNASVYLADLGASGRFSRPVALKVLHPTAAAEERARLRDEARTLGLLRHRAIVGALGMVELEGHPTIVMEAAAGCDLATLLRLGPVPISAALEIVEERASALDHAWRTPREDGEPLRVTHRAIGLHSVRVSAEGGVKLLGFDFARAELMNRLCATRAVSHPLVPAQTQSDEAVSDIFALGALLYHLVHDCPLPRLGARPDTHAAQLAAALDALNTLEPTRSGVIRLLSWMLSFDASARPSSRDVLRQVAELRRQATGPALSTWAAGAVPAASRLAVERPADPLVGKTLNEGGGRGRAPRSTPPGSTPSGSTPPAGRAAQPRTLAFWIAVGAGFSVVSMLSLGFTIMTTPMLFDLAQALLRLV